MYTVMNTLHVVTAVFLVGPMAVLPMSALRLARAGNGAAVERAARSTMIFTLGSLAVLIFGFGLIEAAPEKWNLSLATPWVLISVILYFVALALSLFAVVPALRSVAEHLSEHPAGPDAPATPEPADGAVPRNDYRRIAIVSGVVSLLLLAVVVLMVVRP